MSTPLPHSRVRVQRIAEAAVERARLTVVPRVRRSRSPRVPFVTLVSLLLLGGVVGLLMFNTTMQQNVVRRDRPRAAGRRPHLPRADPPDGARGPPRPAGRRGEGARARHGATVARRPSWLADGSVKGVPMPAHARQPRADPARRR